MVKASFLLDVNVLIPMAWARHQAHGRVQDWISKRADAGWATCPLTQMAFVRILSNPAFSPFALTPDQALELLQTNLAHPRHRFWRDEVDLPRALKSFGPRLSGHKQITDAYLVGLAIHHGGKFATLDQSIVALFPDKDQQRKFIELI
jgi:toxin-antitoxin system PIN domain toxin